MYTLLNLCSINYLGACGYKWLVKKFITFRTYVSGWVLNASICPAPGTIQTVSLPLSISSKLAPTALPSRRAWSGEIKTSFSP